MTDNVYIYMADLPTGINEMVCPCLGGYTIYIDDKLSPSGRLDAYQHAMCHINNHDFEKTDVNQIEIEAHKNCK